jgi:hypothetical protein
VEIQYAFPSSSSSYWHPAANHSAFGDVFGKLLRAWQRSSNHPDAFAIAVFAHFATPELVSGLNHADPARAAAYRRARERISAGMVPTNRTKAAQRRRTKKT